MGMTMTQKILAAHAGLDSVVAGQLIEADLDLVLGNDITSPVAIHEIEKMKVDGVFHKDKIALVMDHFVPNKDIKSAEHCKCVREFACRNEITNYFDVGEMGIEHALLPEKGLTVAGPPVTASSVPTATPVPTVRSEHFLPAWEVRIWQQAWQPVRHGSKYRPLSSSIWLASRINTSAVKT